MSFCTLYFHKCRKRSPLFACHPLLFLSCHHFCHLLSLPFSLFLLFVRVCYLSLSEWLWLLLQSLSLLWLNMSLVSHLLSNGLSKHQTLFHPSFRLFICSPPTPWMDLIQKKGRYGSIQNNTQTCALKVLIHTHIHPSHLICFQDAPRTPSAEIPLYSVSINRVLHRQAVWGLIRSRERGHWWGVKERRKFSHVQQPPPCHK